MLSLFITLFWLSPIFYASTLILGKIFNSRLKKKLGKRGRPKLLIYQVPTIGNVKTVNRIFEAVKKYDLPVRLETWVVIEEDDPHKSEYSADRVIVVPKSFTCEDLYKSRALEYARRLRIEMVKKGELPENYLLLQGDDDSLPSKAFIEECLDVDADLIVGSMSPRPIGVWNTILDYERSVACNIFCNFFTNINKPVFAHGEGMCVKSTVDQTVSYDVSDVNGKKKMLISSEDLFYLHKVSLKRKFRLFGSEKPVYIMPPLNFADAIRQRRRWIWGHIRIVKDRLLPNHNCARLALVESSGLLIYFVSTLGIPLHYLGIIKIPSELLPLTWTTLLLWFAMRGYSIGHLMGWKHGILGMLSSYITVTLNFLAHVIGIIMGDPKRFEVIKKV